ncbi:hypothetical protein LTR16_012528, partial [Cryomyces antarcticus]
SGYPPPQQPHHPPPYGQDPYQQSYQQFSAQHDPYQQTAPSYSAHSPAPGYGNQTVPYEGQNRGNSPYPPQSGHVPQPL